MNLRSTLRRAWPVLLSYGVFSVWGVACLVMSLSLTSGGFGVSPGDIGVVAGLLAATAVGHVAGNLLGLAGFRLAPVAILFFVLFVVASVSGLAIGAIALFLIVALFAAVGGYLGIASRLDVVAAWYPLSFCVGGAIVWMNRHGAVSTFHSGAKHAVWDGFTMLCLTGGVFLMLVFLATRHSLGLTVWQEVARPRSAAVQDEDVAVARPGRGSLLVLFVFTLAVLGATAFVSPYLFRTKAAEGGEGKGEKSAQNDPDQHSNGKDPSNGKSGSGGQGDSTDPSSGGQASGDGESGSGGSGSGKSGSGKSGNGNGGSGGSGSGKSGSGSGTSGDGDSSGSESGQSGSGSGSGKSGSGSGKPGSGSGKSGSGSGKSGSGSGKSGSGSGTPGSSGSPGSGEPGSGESGSGTPGGGSEKSGGSGDGDPLGKPDTDHAGEAASEALNLGGKLFMWLLAAAAALLVLLLIVFPPIRRTLLLRHLERPLWPVAPTARVMNLWRRALAALAVIDIEPSPFESPSDFARRAEEEVRTTLQCEAIGLKEAAALVEKIDYAGRGLGAGEEQTMRDAITTFVQTIEQRVGFKRKAAAAWGRAPEVES